MDRADDFAILDKLSAQGFCLESRAGVWRCDQFSLDDFNASAFDKHPSALVHQAIGLEIAEYILKTKAGFFNVAPGWD